MEGASGLARTCEDPALRVNPLHCRHARERAAATVRARCELEPGNVVGSLAGRIGCDLGGHRAAVDMLPVGAGVMAADRLAVKQQRRDRLAESPQQLAVLAGLTLVNLGTL